MDSLGAKLSERVCVRFFLKTGLKYLIVQPQITEGFLCIALALAADRMD